MTADKQVKLLFTEELRVRFASLSKVLVGIIPVGLLKSAQPWKSLSNGYYEVMRITWPDFLDFLMWKSTRIWLERSPSSYLCELRSILD